MVKNVTFQRMAKSLKSAADTNRWYEQEDFTFNWMDPEFVKCSELVCWTTL